MVHELIGIKNNTVDMTGRSTTDGEAGTGGAPAVLSLASSQDEFYRHNMYSNFGEIGQTIQNLVKEFQQTVRGHQQIESIGDIKVKLDKGKDSQMVRQIVSRWLNLSACCTNISGLCVQLP